MRTSRLARPAFMVLSAIALAAAALPAPAARAADVHAESFDGDVSLAWSTAATDATPNRARKFLGPFNTDATKLHLKDLPPHAFLRISFDLLVIKTWDGNCPSYGPDVFRLDLEGGPTLLDATFSNVDFQDAYALEPAKRQSFPGLLPADDLPAKAGCLETRTLGYRWAYTRPQPVDSVYRLTFTVPHSAPMATFVFSGKLKESVENEAWGLDDVKVQALPAAEVDAPADAELADLWAVASGARADFGADKEVGPDPTQPAAAFWRLVTAGDRTIRFLKQNLKTPAPMEQRFAELRSRLEGDDPAARDAAAAEVRAMGRPAEPLLRATIFDADEPESKARLRAILAGLARTPSADPAQRPQFVARRLAEVIGTPDARALAETLPPVPGRPKNNSDPEPEAHLARGVEVGAGLPLRLVKVQKQSIIVQAAPTDRQAAEDQTLTIDPKRTRVLVGVVTEAARPDRGTARVRFTFKSGGLDDLEPGQQVRVMAEDDFATEIRIIPTPPPPRRDDGAKEEKRDAGK